MWNKIKETIINKHFWIGFCEGFLLCIPILIRRIQNRKIRKEIKQ